MRILYLITKSEIGGAQTHVRELLAYMKNGGHDVALMSAPGGWLEGEARALGVEFYPNSHFSNSYNPLKPIRSILGIRKVLKIFKPDLVACHSSGASFVGRLAVRGRIPTVYTIHGLAFTTGAPLFRKLVSLMAEKLVAPYTSKFICVSEYDKKTAIRYNLAPEKKIAVIHNGVHIESVREHGLTGQIKIVSVGRLAYPKLFDLLIEAVASLSEEVKSKVNLTIIGRGPDQENIENSIMRLGLEKKVFIKGEMSPEEVRVEMRSSDIFALISKHEGLPMTILEAMSAGLPAVASRVGGIPEQIDATSGILVPNDVSAIKEAIEKLVTDKDARVAMGRASYKRAQELFNIEKFLRATETIYREVINGKPL